MPRYRAEIHRTVVYDLEFDADDDEAADEIVHSPDLLDDLVGELPEQDVNVQHFGATRIDE